MGQNVSKKYIETKKSSDQPDLSCQIIQYVMALLNLKGSTFFYTPCIVWTAFDTTGNRRIKRA